MEKNKNSNPSLIKKRTETRNKSLINDNTKKTLEENNSKNMIDVENEKIQEDENKIENSIIKEEEKNTNENIILDEEPKKMEIEEKEENSSFINNNYKNSEEYIESIPDNENENKIKKLVFSNILMIIYFIFALIINVIIEKFYTNYNSGLKYSLLVFSCISFMILFIGYLLQKIYMEIYSNIFGILYHILTYLTFTFFTIFFSKPLINIKIFILLTNLCIVPIFIILFGLLYKKKKDIKFSILHSFYPVFIFMTLSTVLFAIYINDGRNYGLCLIYYILGLLFFLYCSLKMNNIYKEKIENLDFNNFSIYLATHIINESVFLIPLFIFNLITYVLCDKYSDSMRIKLTTTEIYKKEIIKEELEIN